MGENIRSSSNDDKTNTKNNRNKNFKKDKNQKNKKSKRNKPTRSFTGKSSDLNGNVFETFSENRSSTQYEDTVRALQVYATSKLWNGGDIVWLLKNEREFEIDRPVAPDIPRSTRTGDNINQVEMDIYKENIKVYVSRQNRYQENKEKMYSVIWGQCSSSLQSKIQSKLFQQIDRTRDCLQLLKEIKGVMFNFETQ